MVISAGLSGYDYFMAAGVSGYLVLICLMYLILLLLFKFGRQKGPPDDNDLMVVYEPGSEAEFYIVSSIFHEQQIPFFQKNQHIQSLFGHGTAHSGFNPITGPIKVLVKRKDYEKALTVINDYKSNLKNHLYEAEDIELQVLREYKQLITSSIILGIVFPAFGLFYLFKAIRLSSNPILTSKSQIYLIVSAFINIIGLYFWYLIIASV